MGTDFNDASEKRSSFAKDAAFTQDCSLNRGTNKEHPMQEELKDHTQDTNNHNVIVQDSEDLDDETCKCFMLIVIFIDICRRMKKRD